MRTVVIGVGNPTLTDDGVGIHAADRLSERLAERLAAPVSERVGEPGARAADAEVITLCAGGLRLMEAMAGYDRAIVLDALVSGDLPAGTTVELGEGDLASTHNLASAHDMSLSTALAFGTAAGVDLPRDIRIFGVRAADVTTFGERLSPSVTAAVPALVERILSLLTSGEPPVDGEPPADGDSEPPERTRR